MLLKSLLLIFPIGFGFLFTYIFELYTGLILPISIILSVLIGVLLYVIFVAILFFGYIPIAKKISPVNKFNVFLLKQYASVALMFTNVSVKVMGKENLKDFDLKKEKFILTPNHKSLIDVVAMYKVFPGIGYIAKKEVFNMPIIPAYFKAMGVIPIDRNNDREAAKGIIQGVKKVKSLEPMCIFPEGGIKTRETDKMVEIKAGAYKLATKAEASIIPISIKNNSLISKRSPLKRTKLILTIHKPIKYSEYKDLTTQEIGNKVFEIVNSVL